VWLWQTRTGKRTAPAAVRIAVDLVRERLLSQSEAVCRVDPHQLDHLLHPTIDPKAQRIVLARGLPASPGAAVGGVVFSSDAAELRAKAGEEVILVRAETSPEDIHGLHAAQGVLTTRGGMTSHAAVVARGMGKPCVVGCGEAHIREATEELNVDGRTLHTGDEITLDGATGEVMLGRLPTVMPELGAGFVELMEWADRLRTVKVRTNVDTPQDARVARQFGAEGIGLCRTEHMFFEPARILAMQKMILASSAEERAEVLSELLPLQRGDFAGIFEAMDGLPVTIRLLDPPLHEFLPQTEADILELAGALGKGIAAVRATLESLREFNPMLGHRGCRLGITYPEIYEMQVRAIAAAAREVAERGVDVHPEIMVPLVAHHGELERLRALVVREVEETLRGSGSRIHVLIGTMIEVPRAALTADAIASFADFFSFGTNDLTQMTYAMSRDDASRFLPEYVESGILAGDPFVSIDEDGIGALVEIAIEKGRRARPGLKMGLCGEHGGDPRSVDFCHRVGIDYVSCSPYRIPIARLAAAQAAVAARRA
jgi:pyruvate,orthophosphate dikinase